MFDPLGGGSGAFPGFVFDFGSDVVDAGVWVGIFEFCADYLAVGFGSDGADGDDVDYFDAGFCAFGVAGGSLGIVFSGGVSDEVFGFVVDFLGLFDEAPEFVSV